MIDSGFEYMATFTDEDGGWYNDTIQVEIKTNPDGDYPEGDEERAREIADSWANEVCENNNYSDYEIRLIDAF